jgi:hypothetical protein
VPKVFGLVPRAQVPSRDLGLNQPPSRVARSASTNQTSKKKMVATERAVEITIAADTLSN